MDEIDLRAVRDSLVKAAKVLKADGPGHDYLLGTVGALTAILDTIAPTASANT
jgi:hypothetical protein